MTDLPWTSAWVVGGSTGLGRCLSEQLAKIGVRCTVSARSEQALKELAESSENLIALPLDICDPDEVARSVERIATDHDGLPDLIILNAAVYTPMGADTFSAQAIRDMIDVNYLGLVNLVEALLPFKDDGKRSTIAFVASPSGWRGLPGGVGYGPTKAAVINLVEGLRCELSDSDLDLRLVNPGFIKTRLTDKNDFDMPQLMEPEDAARRTLNGLKGKRFDIRFPHPFVSVLRLLRLLPYWLYFKLMRSKR